MSAQLTHVLFFSGDVPALADWYRQVLAIDPVLQGTEYAELPAGQAILSIFERSRQNELAPGSAEAGVNRNSIVEFRLADVEAEFRRLLPLGLEWVKPPTTQPLGNRSAYPRDPEGNLVSLDSRAD